MQIRTDRLLIRPIEAADWPAIRRIWISFSTSPFAQYDMPHSTDPDDVRPRIARWAQATAAGTDHLFFAVCPEEAVIGYIACNRREASHELGYCFHATVHGKGYAGEAHRALFPCLRSLGINRLTAGTALNNTPSVKLLTSLGFRLTGTEQVSFYKDAQGRDIVFEGCLFELQLTGGTSA